jgi:hypothetical protein
MSSAQCVGLWRCPARDYAGPSIRDPMPRSRMSPRGGPMHLWVGDAIWRSEMGQTMTTREERPDNSDVRKQRHRVSIAQIAAAERWVRESNRTAATAAARRGLRAKFEQEADPEQALPPEERARRADSLMRAHMLRMAQPVCPSTTCSLNATTETLSEITQSDLVDLPADVLTMATHARDAQVPSHRFIDPSAGRCEVGHRYEFDSSARALVSASEHDGGSRAGSYRRSPRARRRCASRARSSAALAAWRPTISRERHPVTRIRSCSCPPAASQSWAKVCRNWCGCTGGIPRRGSVARASAAHRNR